MRFFKKTGASLARSVVLSLGLFSTHQQTLARTVDTFVEIKGASLLTPGQSGLQVIRLNDRATLQVEPDDIVVRDGTVFLKEQIARSAGIPGTDLGMLLEMVEAEQGHQTASHGQLGTIASTVGMVAGTLVVSSTMDDLSDDLLTLSTTALDTLSDDSAEEALDAEEETQTETPEETPTNNPPTFGEAPTGGAASESAATGSAVGAVVQATDPENTAIAYTIAEQEIDGAFSVDALSGVIRVADPSKLNFESNDALDVTIAATDGGGESVEQTVTIAILDDPTDTLSTTPLSVVSHPEFSSGALVLSDVDDGTVYFGHAGIESTSNQAEIALYVRPFEYLNHEIYGLDPEYDLTAPGFTALAEINTGELQNGLLTLTSTVENPNNTLQFTVDTSDFSGETAFLSPARVKTVDRGISGTPEETYTLADGTITKLGDGGFTQTNVAFDIGAGDLWHLADISGDGVADLIIKTAGVGEAVVYENLGTTFDTDVMSETLFTGVDLDALAGGRALDISVREHFTDGNLSVMLLGETETYLYELT